MSWQAHSLGWVLATLLVFQSLRVQAEPAYDVVINGGRVIDPESGLDAVRHLGISGDQIVAVSDSPLEAKTVIDATGLVVAPGFIYLHAHGQNIGDYRMQVMLGVTTMLELESSGLPIQD